MGIFDFQMNYGFYVFASYYVFEVVSELLLMKFNSIFMRNEVHWRECVANWKSILNLQFFTNLLPLLIRIHCIEVIHQTDI